MVSVWDYINIGLAEKNRMISGTKFSGLNQKILDEFKDLADPDLVNDLFTNLYFPLCNLIAGKFKIRGSPLVVGVSGAQGTGKTTLARIAEIILTGYFSLKVASFSLDDLYLQKSERRKLAREVHPLFETRGVPGTHDAKAGTDLIRSLRTLETGQTVKLPVFNKGTDDRLPESCWNPVHDKTDIILFEGWCVGATSQDESDLIEPVNDLERQQDRKCTWRKCTNNNLLNDYKALFSEIDFLIFLCAPDFEKVYEWRARQEKELSVHQSGSENTVAMTDAGVRNFIMYFERLTKHMIKTMPGISDITIYLDDNQIPFKIDVPGNSS